MRSFVSEVLLASILICHPERSEGSALELPGQILRRFAPQDDKEKRGDVLLDAVAELDRAAAIPLWPGFDPRRIPLEIFDGERTWLLRHPAPPLDFEPSGRRDDLRVFPGRHPTARANSATDLAGVATATVLLDRRAPRSARSLAALLAHETFHVFQGKRHPKWGANEADFFLYPFDDAEALALRRLESAALRKALAAGHGKAAPRWAARALALRRERFARLPAICAAYERGTETKEGLARYVERRVAGPTEAEALFPQAEFPAGAIRERGYASGCALALLLDSLDPGWQSRLEEKDGVPLDELLARAVGSASPADSSAGETREARLRAAQDAAALVAGRAARRRDFLAAAGWRVVVETRAPLFPQQFDPLNVERLSDSEILHTRWVKLGNASGSLEVLDGRCLTEASGKHPLFDGIRRVTISGLPAEPLVDETSERIKITANGLTLELSGARLERSDRTLLVTLP